VWRLNIFSMRMAHWKALAGWMVTATFGWAAGPFVPPADGPVPFRRDRIPLEVEEMRSLSRSLSGLSSSLDPATPEGRRAVAQTLALAAALDLGNREARELIGSFQETGAIPPVDDAVREARKGQVWPILKWLNDPRAGADAKALALCLEDVMAAIEPAHPSLTEHAGEQGAWTGWIPELASYRAPEVTTQVAPEPPPAAVFTHTLGRVSTPLWVYDGELKKKVLRSQRVDMIASAEGTPEAPLGPFTVLVSGPENETIPKIVANALNALESYGLRFPALGQITLNCENGYWDAANKMSLSAATVLLLDSAVSVRQPEVTVIGIVTDDGQLTLPGRAWEHVRALSDGPGGRLILPKQAEPFLPAILALGDSKFFAKYEVVLAGNLQELLERSDKLGQGAFAESSARYREIMEKQGTTDLNQYVASPPVRRRLGEIAQAFPDLASPRLLEIQGAGKRPTLLPRLVLAAEMHLAMEPLEQMLSQDVYYSDPIVDAVAEACRAAVAKLDRYSEISDRDLSERAHATVGVLRSLSKARRNGSYESAVKTLRTNYEELSLFLRTIAGDPPPQADSPPRKKSKKR
jgi:hypothetical protein